MHISNTVSKLGVNIGCINLPPIVTCNPNAPCINNGKCYAQHCRFKYPNVIKSLNNNLRDYKNDLGFYFASIINKCNSTGMQHFRWHSSGDIVDKDYLHGMVRVAENCPNTKFLAFTKKFDLVNEFIDNGGKIPGNLSIVFSAWGNFLPDNKHNLPVAYVHLKDEEGAEHIPHNAKPCGGKCDTCTKTTRSCWDLKHGESVVFNEHK